MYFLVELYYLFFGVTVFFSEFNLLLFSYFSVVELLIFEHYIIFRGLYYIIFERELYYFWKAPVGCGSPQPSEGLIGARYRGRGDSMRQPRDILHGLISPTENLGLIPLTRTRLGLPKNNVQKFSLKTNII